MQQVGNPSVENGNSNPARTGHTLYVGITPHEPNGVEEDKNEKGNEKEENMTKEKEKNIRRIEYGLLLVVPARIFGKSVRALIDSGATRCFVSPSCVATVGLKGVPRDIFLELGNGEKYLSQGYFPDVPVVAAGLTVKVGLTVTNML